MKEQWKYACIGALAGIANGLFGAGGGLFLVPLYTFWCQMDTKKALATSVAVILPLSLISFVIFLFHGTLPWRTAVLYLLGGIVGGILSGAVFKKLSATWLKRLFGILLICGGVRAVLKL